MPHSIVKLLRYPKNPVYNTVSFRNILESHLVQLSNSKALEIVQIEPNIGTKYVCDFYGLLQELEVLPDHNWITMRLNDLISTTDYDGTVLYIKLPPIRDIELIMNRYLTDRS